MKTLLALYELAAETGIPIGTLRQLCSPKGDLECVRTHVGPSAKRKTHGRIYVQRSDWDAWVERHRSSAPTETSAQSIERAVRTRSVLDLPGAEKYVS